MIPAMNFFFTHTGRKALANRNGLEPVWKKLIRILQALI
jgi:hypothetical protein